MTSPTPLPPDLLERLSALTDGEIDGHEAAAACALWEQEPSVRTSWHAYQLIGDVLRSQDLAADPARDAAFLGALRHRLNAESRALAPALDLGAVPPPVRVHRSPSAAPTASTGTWSLPWRRAHGPRRWEGSWIMGSAVLATFVGVVVFRGLFPSPPDTSEVATVPARAPQSVTAAADASQSGGRPVESAGASVPATGHGSPPTLLRDPRLDAYLAAHQQFAGTSALGVPSAFLRGATSPREQNAP